MFRLTKKPINLKECMKGFSSPKAGAFVFFEGRVRNETLKHKVSKLDYAPLSRFTLKEGRKILNEAKKRFDVLSIKCVHRTGILKVGERTIWIGAMARSRKDAFESCRYVIEQIKKRLPIVKKEFYA